MADHSGFSIEKEGFFQEYVASESLHTDLHKWGNNPYSCGFDPKERAKTLNARLCYVGIFGGGMTQYIWLFLPDGSVQKGVGILDLHPSCMLEEGEELENLPYPDLSEGEWIAWEEKSSRFLVKGIPKLEGSWNCSH